MDPDQRTRILERLGAAANLDSAHLPGIDAGDVVDDDRGPPASPDIAVSRTPAGSSTGRSRGLLARRRGVESDGRVTLAELTREDRSRLERFISILARTIDPLFDDWPPERQGEALAMLNGLADTLESAADQRLSR